MLSEIDPGVKSNKLRSLSNFQEDVRRLHPSHFESAVHAQSDLPDGGGGSTPNTLRHKYTERKITPEVGVYLRYTNLQPFLIHFTPVYCRLTWAMEH